MRKILLTLMAFLSMISVKAQDENIPAFRTWAPTAPMGWNSWDCYYSTVNEELVLQNARYMQEHLRDYGWEYVVIDIRWYANHPSLGGGWYNQTKTPECQLDEYGRYVPSTLRFPSANVNGKNEGFKALADQLHAMGLKFGIHIMRGLPKYILEAPEKYKLKGAEGVSWSQVYKSNTPECAWLQDNLTIQNNEWGQKYYDSIVELYASWGVDFIKVDDMSRPYYASEIEMLRKSIDKCGRPIVLSLSPGKTAYDQVEHLHNSANQWRMMDDLWDRWDDVKAVFKEAAYWSQHHVTGCYADCDMLPLGKISMTVGDDGYCNADAGRMTKLTKDEQYTMMSLWGICHSPLFFGGEMTKNDAFTNSLLTNRDYLRMHAKGVNAHEVSNADGKIVWTSEDPENGDRWLAMFYTDAGNGWIYDNKALYASETVAYTTDGHKVDVNISLPEGTKELALVVDDAGDGFSYDHGDWINPTFISKNGYKVPVTSRFIKDKYTNSFYNTINENTNVLGNASMSVLNKKYSSGFSMDANAMILFNVPDSIVGFTAMGALDDSGIGQPNSTTSVKFYVFDCDPRVSKTNQPATAKVSCDLSSFGYKNNEQLSVYDVWSGDLIKTMSPGVLEQDIYAHGVRLMKITSNSKKKGRFGQVELADTTSNGMVTEVAFYTPQIVNVRHYQENSAVQKKNLVVTLAKQDVAVSVDAISDHEIALSSNQLRVIYNKETGNVAFYDLQGNQLLKEKEGRTDLTQRKDGTEDSYRVKQTFSLQSGEKLYGLGQLQNGNWNQRGKTYDYMIEGNTSVWIPYLHSSKGYALYWDNASPTSYKDNNTGMSFESAVGYGVDYFFLQGSPTDGQEAVCQMRQLTGQVPMIPLWAYGFFQSKERYQSADETMSVVNRYRRLGVPLDCVVQDWQYWGDNAHWNAMSFLNPKFSNYQEMIDSVHNMNAHILISSWANFGPATQPYAYFKEHNELMKQGDNIMTDTYPSNEGVAIYDAYNEDARNHYWQFLYDGVVSKGIDAYWLDSSEPDHYQGGTQMEQTFDFETGMGCTWRSVRNAFPLVHVGGVYDHHRAEPNLSSKRCMILTRSGYAGLQRYGANTWSGDITASWQTLANQIPAALSYSVCGLPNWNSDTGAFFNGDLQGPGNDEYNELYARWFQFSTFCPMMRSHGAGTDKAIYVWGKQGNPFFDNEERYIHLRYALLPYIYSTAWNVHQQGLSFMNPMALMFPEDSKTQLLKNQYMFGQSFIVAPILSYKATQRSVYLPAGSKWVDFWTGEQMDGGQSMTKKFDLQTLPLYVRAGSIVPFALPAQTAKVSDWDTLQVRIYPGADGNFELYEDEGDNYNYEKGQYSTISFHWDDANGRLTIGHREGTFKGMLTKRVFDVVVVGEEMGKGNELSSSIHKRIEYDGSEVSVDIDLAKTEEVSYGRGEISQDATDVELSLDDFNAKINGNGTFGNNTFTPVAKGFGGWWNSNGIVVAHHRYMVVELEEPSAKEMALRIYPKDEYNSAPLSAHFSAGKTKMAIETGDHSFIYGAGIWSNSRQAIKLHRVYFTNTLSEDVATDEASPYTFVPTDWQTGDGGRVNQRNISYDTDKGTILVKASGEQNTCLQLAASKSDLYKFSNQKKFFCVKASNVSSVQNNAQLWFMLGNHVGVVTPSKVFASADGDIVTAWDISTWMPKSEQVHLCYGNTFIICFGLTSTIGESLISDINFYAEDELENIGTGIETPRQEAKKLMDSAIYDLQGRNLQGKPQPGLYICNGKKFIIK